MASIQAVRNNCRKVREAEGFFLVFKTRVKRGITVEEL